MASRDFADYCCELLASLGSCVPKRMFGGWGLSVDGLNVAIVTDLGSGEKLWLKADADTVAEWEAAGCERFTYPMNHKGVLVPRSMNYYSAPESAMDAAHAMAPWARLALEAALRAKATKPAKPAETAKTASKQRRR